MREHFSIHVPTNCSRIQTKNTYIHSFTSHMPTKCFRNFTPDTPTKILAPAPKHVIHLSQCPNFTSYVWSLIILPHVLPRSGLAFAHKHPHSTTECFRIRTEILVHQFTSRTHTHTRRLFHWYMFACTWERENVSSLKQPKCHLTRVTQKTRQNRAT